TYLRSVKAREAETAVKGIYDRVYEAARPEVFFKATASRCVGPYEPICLRSDSKWNVPEAELAFIVGEGNRIVAYTIGNDMSSRSIEGQNPLYLTQAKVYRGCCALGPAVVTPESIGNPSNLQIECEILRGGRRVFHSETNTSRMKRSLEELLNYLTRDNPIPPGTVCLTGTDIVPPDDFTLRHDDIVRITIENIGALTNPVRQL
ncbi:MAG: fumarylacetoacetate hydrolase family protein, partial [Candidatus Bathyarchaeia archaeon]